MIVRKTVILVDDHPIVRQGFRQLLSQDTRLQIVGEAESAVDALRLCREHHPDLALVDLSLKESSGLELIKDIRTIFTGTAVLVVTLHDESVYAERALKAGARGFLTKEEAPETVRDAIQTVLSGNIYLSRSVETSVLESLSSGAEDLMKSLSDRELEVFTLIGEGIATRAIAEKLGLSVKTVETYRSHVKDKLGLRDGSDLVRKAVEWRLREHGSLP